MVTVYQCNRCGETMTFDEDKYVILNLGAGRQEAGFENNKVDDLCPKCYIEVEEFITDKEPAERQMSLEQMIKFMKENNYVVYKPKPKKRGKL
jgi:hypothetical protein